MPFMERLHTRCAVDFLFPQPQRARFCRSDGKPVPRRAGYPQTIHKYVDVKQASLHIVPTGSSTTVWTDFPRHAHDCQTYTVDRWLCQQSRVPIRDA